MTTDVIVLNGGSSSGTSTLARALQDLLPRPWLTLGVDTLVDAMPPGLLEDPAGLDLAPDGTVTAGPGFQALEESWARGVAAIARAGTGVVVDEVFVGGAASQQRWRTALEGLRVLWVGVHCSPEAATARERERPDRTPGMAAAQARLVHRGVTYDLEVDTTDTSPEACARIVAAHVS